MTLAASEDPLLGIGDRVRQQRGKLGLRISDLADLSGLSARYISDLERGKANISIRKLSEVAVALRLPVKALVPAGEKTHPRKTIDSMLEDCSEEELQRVLALIGLVLGKERPRVVAMLGIRGAGKSTVGRALAEELSIPFVELKSRIETLAGIPQSAIYSFHGERYHRRLEFQALTDILSKEETCVVALPGGIVAHAEAFELVKESCLSIWLRATPEEYLGRVYAQGDTRPMESCTDAMVELRRLVEERAPLYQQATISLDTSGKSVEEMVASLSQSLEGRMMTVCPFICSPF